MGFLAAGAHRSYPAMNPMPRRIETHLLDGPAGKLETLLEAPEDTTPRAAALVCHPHPLFGGTMHNKVVHRVAQALRRRCAVPVTWCCASISAAWGEARAATTWAWAKSRMRARHSAGCVTAIRTCRTPWRGFRSAPGWS